MLNPIPRNRAELAHLIASSAQLAPLLAEAARSGNGDSAHDSAHLLRVALWTLRIGGAEIDLHEAIAAALLHDLVNIPKDHADRARASELSANAAAPLLNAAGFSPEAVLRIQAAIREHSFSRGGRPSGPLGMALQDADRLEAIGAIGLMRVFATGAKMGTKFFAEGDAWAQHRPLDDKKYSIDHFFTKLLGLAKTMNTDRGREEARARIKPLEEFLTHLAREIGEDRP